MNVFCALRKKDFGRYKTKYPIIDKQNNIKKLNINKLIPDTKIRLNHTQEINNVCPISGCKTKTIIIGNIIRALKKNLK